MNEDTHNALAAYARIVDRYRDRRENERWVKRFLIEPLLDALGWNPHNPDLVIDEYPVQRGSSLGSADYVLQSGRDKVSVVEAKAEELRAGGGAQALSDARTLRIPWAVVTNGKELRFYGADLGTSDDADEALIFDALLDPEHIQDAVGFLRYLAPGMIDSPEAHDRFEAWHQRRALRGFLEKNKDALIGEVAKWIGEEWTKGEVDRDLVSSILGELFGAPKEAMIIKTGPVVTKCPKCGADLQEDDGTGKSTVTAGDFRHAPQGGRGVFELISDPSKRIDVSLPGPKVEAKLAELGLKLSGSGAFGGFYYNLRREAGLIRRR